MALVSMKDLLHEAARGGYAVGNFDVFNVAQLKGVMLAQERMQAPLILAYGPPFEPFVPMHHFAQIMRSYAEDTDLPVAIHLDHATTLDEVKRAVASGFTAVMIDASAESFEENIRRTKEVVAFCKPRGIPVEAELGHVGAEGEEDPETYGLTDPNLAAEFVERTGIDALAVAIGNVHGVYRKAPDIRFELLQAVRSQVGVPLVLHGASGIPAEDIRRCTKLGITKINIHTELLQAAAESLAEGVARQLGYNELYENHVQAVQARTEQKMELFGSAGKA